MGNEMKKLEKTTWLVKEYKGDGTIDYSDFENIYLTKEGKIKGTEHHWRGHYDMKGKVKMDGSFEFKHEKWCWNQPGKPEFGMHRSYKHVYRGQMEKDGVLYATMDDDKDNSKYEITLDEPLYHGTIKGNDDQHNQEITMGLKFRKDMVYGNGRDHYGVFVVYGKEDNGKVEFELEYVDGSWKMTFNGEIWTHGEEKVLGGHWSHSQGSGTWEVKGKDIKPSALLEKNK